MADSEKKSKKPANKQSFWKGLKGQFKTISWPTRDTVAKESTAAIVISVILSVVIALVDVVIRFGLGFLVK